ncbi:MAG: arginyltransferase [Methylothermaceae bacterium]|nr:arginyltransferase [Methylothermaceae bacterium]
MPDAVRRNSLAELNALELYLSAPHPCAYLPGKTAQMIFLPPDIPLSMPTYNRLVGEGFRRSGDLVYRPRCPGCSACVPVRIPARHFRPNRSQKRCFKCNQDLEVIARAPEFHPDHYHLYQRYLKARHPDGSMADATPDDYMAFLTCHWCETLFYEFRRQGKLVMVAVVDLLDDGLSAVYTFFDPELSRRGLGTYAVLWEIAAIKRLEMEYLYLGYWIETCPQMAYKSKFRPQQRYQMGAWRTPSPKPP